KRWMLVVLSREPAMKTTLRISLLRRPRQQNGESGSVHISWLHQSSPPFDKGSDSRFTTNSFLCYCSSPGLCYSTRSLSVMTEHIPKNPFRFAWFITREYRPVAIGAVLAVCVATALESAV